MAIRTVSLEYAEPSFTLLTAYDASTPPTPQNITDGTSYSPLIYSDFKIEMRVKGDVGFKRPPTAFKVDCSPLMVYKTVTDPLGTPDLTFDVVEGFSNGRIVIKGREELFRLIASDSENYQYVKFDVTVTPVYHNPTGMTISIVEDAVAFSIGWDSFAQLVSNWLFNGAAPVIDGTPFIDYAGYTIDTPAAQ